MSNYITLTELNDLARIIKALNNAYDELMHTDTINFPLFPDGPQFVYDLNGDLLGSIGHGEDGFVLYLATEEAKVRLNSAGAEPVDVVFETLPNNSGHLA